MKDPIVVGRRAHAADRTRLSADIADAILSTRVDTIATLRLHCARATRVKCATLHARTRLQSAKRKATDSVLNIDDRCNRKINEEAATAALGGHGEILNLSTHLRLRRIATTRLRVIGRERVTEQLKLAERNHSFDRLLLRRPRDVGTQLRSRNARQAA